MTNAAVPPAGPGSSTVTRSRPKAVEEPHGNRQRTSLVAELWVFLPLGAVMLLLLASAREYGAPGGELLTAVAGVLLLQTLPGALVWRAIRPERGWLIEDIAVGTAIGAALAVPSQVAAVAVGATWLTWAVPVGLVILLASLRRCRQRILRATSERLPGGWGLGVAASTVVASARAVQFFADQPFRWEGWAAPYVDLPYHLGLVGEVAHQWPLSYPQLAGDDLHYHWFSHAWTANVASNSSAGLDVALGRVTPLILAVVLPTLTATVAMRLSGFVWTGPAAAALGFAATDLTVSGLGSGSIPLTPYSPSQGFGVLMLLPVLSLLALRWRGQASRGAGPVLVLVLVVGGGAKGTVLPLLMAGMVMSLLVALAVRSSARWTILRDTAMVCVVLLVLLATVFGGGVGGTSVSPLESIRRARVSRLLESPSTASAVALIVVVALVLASALLGSSAALVCVHDRIARRDPIVWLLLGSSAAGVAAVLVLDHPGLSNFYFLFTVAVPLAVLTAWGLALVLSGLDDAKQDVLGGLAVGVVAVLVAEATLAGLATWPLRAAVLAMVVFLATIGVGSGAYVRLRRSSQPRRALTATALVGLAVASVVSPTSDAVQSWWVRSDPPSPKTDASFHSSQVAAAQWIRDNSEPVDVVMSNRHCRGEEINGCDARRFYVSAFSERSVLVEGWAYTRTANSLALERGVNARTIEFWDEELLRLNDDFILEPTATAAEELWELGVRWLFIDHTGPHLEDYEPYATARISTPWATVYELAEP